MGSYEANKGFLSCQLIIADMGDYHITYHAIQSLKHILNHQSRKQLTVQQD